MTAIRKNIQFSRLQKFKAMQQSCSLLTHASYTFLQYKERVGEVMLPIVNMAIIWKEALLEPRRRPGRAPVVVTYVTEEVSW